MSQEKSYNQNKNVEAAQVSAPRPSRATKLHDSAAALNYSLLQADRLGLCRLSVCLSVCLSVYSPSCSSSSRSTGAHKPQGHPLHCCYPWNSTAMAQHKLARCVDDDNDAPSLPALIYRGLLLRQCSTGAAASSPGEPRSWLCVQLRPWTP